MIEKILSGAIGTLGHPRAALFGFGLTMVAADVLSAVRASQPKSDVEVSGYDLADELSGTYRGDDDRDRAVVVVGVRSDE